MSRERAKARAVREAEAETRRAAAQKQLDRKTRADARRASLPKVPTREPVYRFRRFSRLTWRVRVALGLGWLFTAAVVLYLVPSWTGRLGLLVVATAALPLIVVLALDPSRRTR